MLLDSFKTLYGKHKFVFYIYTPAYLEQSAGLRALHYLCHALNSIGFNAWLVISSVHNPKNSTTSGFLLTPTLDKKTAKLHFENQMIPIVIYSETVIGNPLNAQYVVRWLLNYPGDLGGPTNFAKNEFILSYTDNIKNSISMQSNKLFLPPLDIREILEFQKSKKRNSIKKENFSLVYAGKYRGFIGNPKLPRLLENLEIIEIFREGPHKQSRKEVFELLQSARMLICYENSTLITEALLFGTPVVLVRSPFFSELIAEQELKTIGCIWDIELNNLSEIPKFDKAEVLEVYEKCIEKFYSDLNKFTKDVLKFWGYMDYLQEIKLPNSNKSITLIRVKLAYEILKNKGFFVLVRIVHNFIKRRIFNG